MSVGRLQWRALVDARIAGAICTPYDDPVHGRRHVVSAGDARLGEGRSPTDAWKSAHLLLQKSVGDRMAHSPVVVLPRLKSRGSTREPLIRSRFGFA